jgi:hypothetical protein
MGPHADHGDDPLRLVEPVDQPMLDVAPAGIRAREIAQNLAGGNFFTASQSSAQGFRSRLQPA